MNKIIINPGVAFVRAYFDHLFDEILFHRFHKDTAFRRYEFFGDCLEHRL